MNPSSPQHPDLGPPASRAVRRERLLVKRQTKTPETWWAWHQATASGWKGVAGKEQRGRRLGHGGGQVGGALPGPRAA